MSLRARILIIEPQTNIRKGLVQILREEGYVVTAAATCARGLGALAESHFDVVVTELKLEKGATGLDVLKAAKASVTSPAVIMFTAYAQVGPAVEAMRLGARNLVQKPSDVEEIIVEIATAAAERFNDQQSRMVARQSVRLEEDESAELKAIRGSNPIDTIRNHADEYAVAYLNARGGRILWGIRDVDRVVEGVRLTAPERDRLRRDVRSKLTTIRPTVDPSSLRLRFIPVCDENEKIITDLFVVELAVEASRSKILFWTGGNEAFVKVEGVKRKLTGPEIQEWIERRLRESP